MVFLFARGGRGGGLWGGCGERSQGTSQRAGAVRAGGWEHIFFARGSLRRVDHRCISVALTMSETVLYAASPESHLQPF